MENVRIFVEAANTRPIPERIKPKGIVKSITDDNKLEININPIRGEKGIDERGNKCIYVDEKWYIYESTVPERQTYIDSDTPITKSFEIDLFHLINQYMKKGLSKSDLVCNMEYATESCIKS